MRQQREETNELKEFMKKFNTMSELYKKEMFDKPSIEVLIPRIERFGEYLARRAGLKTAQIRKFFSSVKRIQNEMKCKRAEPKGKKGVDIRQRVIRLKPALAYATARQRSQLKDFSEVITLAMDMVKTQDDFNYFVEFLEAIVAYHKYHGGKD